MLQRAAQLPHMNELAAAALEARARIHGHVLCTNLMRSHWLSTAGSCSAFIKMESEQHTNSFKVSEACMSFCIGYSTLYGISRIRCTDS
jgi:threonine dehydratase